MHRALFALFLCAPWNAFSQSYTIQTFAGGGLPVNMPGVGAELGYVPNLTVDPRGNVYLPLNELAAVAKLDTAGRLSLVAGTGVAGNRGDGGPATEAQLSGPTAVALDTAGNLYIAEAVGRIRKVAAVTGIISTLSYAASCPYGMAFQRGGGQSAGVQDTALFVADLCANKVLRIDLTDGSTLTVAGTGTAGSSGDGGPAQLANLNGPIAVAVDGAGNLLIADSYNNKIRKIDPGSGIISTWMNDFVVMSLAADSAGNVYTAHDYGLLQITPAGAVTSIVPVAARGVAVGPSGALYTTLWPASQRSALSKVVNGSVVTIAGGGLNIGDHGPATAAQLSYPGDVAVNAKGVFIADRSPGRIREVVNGTITTVAGSGVCCDTAEGGAATSAWILPAASIALDSDGNIYIGGDHNVRKVDHATGRISTVVGRPDGSYCGLGDGGPATSGCISSTGGLAFDSVGNLYISDSMENRVRMVDARTGMITTVAGDGNCGWEPDGMYATASGLCMPESIAVDSQNNLYIADSQNRRIAKVDSINHFLTTAVGAGPAGSEGDGGPARMASMSCPAAVAFDAADNMYLSDSCTNAIRRVDHASGIITALTGSGMGEFGGDGGPAVYADPGGLRLAVDSSGQIYAVDKNHNRIRVLIPTSNSGVSVGSGEAGDSGAPGGPDGTAPSDGSVPARPCASASVFPAQSVLDASGGTISLLVKPQNRNCDWVVAYYPSWVKVSPETSSGIGTLTLTVAPNTGASRSAHLYVSGATAEVIQNAPATVCRIAIDPPGTGFPSSGAPGTINVTAKSGCAWHMGTPPAWITWTGGSSGIGSGSVGFAVAANDGGPRSASLPIAGLATAVNQNGVIEGPAGVMGHFAAGAGWQTTFTLANYGSIAAHANLNFFDDAGRALTPQSVRTSGTTAPASTANSADTGPLLNPGALLQIDAPAGTTTSQTGWAQVVSDGFVGGFGIFRLPVDHGFQEAVVPAENRNSSAFILPFDNTGGYFYGVAVANLSSTDQVIHVTLRDAITGGTLAGEQFSLPASGHTQFLLTDHLPKAAGMTGTAEFAAAGSAAGNISVLGLRFNSNHAFTSVPVFVHGSQTAGAPMANAGAMSHIAFGGGWTTLFTFVNTGAAAAHTHLNFYGDKGGVLAVPMRLPLSPSVTLQATPSFDKILDPGAMMLLECAEPADQVGQTGWVKMSTDGSVRASAVFRYTTGNVSQEAAVPLAPLNTGASMLAFDSTNGYTNGVALANNSATAVIVPVVVRDAATGQPMGTDGIQLPAWGHSSFMLADRFPGTSGQRGTIEFGATSGQVSVLGLRVNSNSAFTSIPPIAMQ